MGNQQSNFLNQLNGLMGGLGGGLGQAAGGSLFDQGNQQAQLQAQQQMNSLYRDQLVRGMSIQHVTPTEMYKTLTIRQELQAEINEWLAPVKL